VRPARRSASGGWTDEDFYEWYFNRTSRETDEGNLIVHLDDLIGCRAVDLLNAMRAMERAEIGYPEVIFVSQGPRDKDLSGFRVTPVQFQLGDNNNLVLHLLHLIDEWEDDGKVLHQRVETALAPLLTRNGLRLVSAEYDPYYTAVLPYHLNIDLSVRLRGQDLHTRPPVRGVNSREPPGGRPCGPPRMVGTFRVSVSEPRPLRLP
jgi:hypothetical protein